MGLALEGPPARRAAFLHDGHLSIRGLSETAQNGHTPDDTWEAAALVYVESARGTWFGRRWDRNMDNLFPGSPGHHSSGRFEARLAVRSEAWGRMEASSLTSASAMQMRERRTPEYARFPGAFRRSGTQVLPKVPVPCRGGFMNAVQRAGPTRGALAGPHSMATPAACAWPWNEPNRSNRSQ